MSQWVNERVTDKHCQWSDLGPIITNNIDHGHSLVWRCPHEIGRSYSVDSIISSLYLVWWEKSSQSWWIWKVKIDFTCLLCATSPLPTLILKLVRLVKVVFTPVPTSPQISSCLNMRRGPLQTLPYLLMTSHLFTTLNMISWNIIMSDILCIGPTLEARTGSIPTNHDREFELTKMPVKKKTFWVDKNAGEISSIVKSSRSVRCQFGVCSASNSAAPSSFDRLLFCRWRLTFMKLVICP